MGEERERNRREQESNGFPVGSAVRALASQDAHLASDSYAPFTWASSSVFEYPIPPFVGALLSSGRMLFSESGLSEWSSTTKGFWLHWEQSLTSGGLSFPLCTVGTVICLLPPGLAGWDDELAAWLHQVRPVAVMRVMLWPVSLQGSRRSGEMDPLSLERRGNPCLHSLGRSLFICSSKGLSATSQLEAARAFSQHLPQPWFKILGVAGWVPLDSKSSHVVREKCQPYRLLMEERSC